MLFKCGEVRVPCVRALFLLKLVTDETNGTGTSILRALERQRFGRLRGERNPPHRPHHGLRHTVCLKV